MATEGGKQRIGILDNRILGKKGKMYLDYSRESLRYIVIYKKRSEKDTNYTLVP